MNGTALSHGARGKKEDQLHATFSLHLYIFGLNLIFPAVDHVQHIIWDILKVLTQFLIIWNAHWIGVQHQFCFIGMPSSG